MPIAQHFDPLAAADLRLLPEDATTVAQVKADWATYNGGMGSDVAQFAYFHLLPERSLMAPVFAEPVPPVEAWLTPPLYPAMRALIGKLLKLSAANATQAADNMRRSYDETDRCIADGRPFLCGERMTLGDVALAAAAAPLLQPRGYGAKMPPIDQMPAPVLALIEEFEARPMAAFVQRLYDVLRPA
jgi:glutathione S-transferase